MSNKKGLSHIDKANNPTMVDVSQKSITIRKAVAQSIVCLPNTILQLFEDGEIHTKKGSVFQTAIIAGTMAAKKTSELIPFCHPLALENCKIKINIQNGEVVITAEVMVTAKTGVEMEALTAVTVAALTVYDMCKAAGQGIIIKEAKLLSKTGGKKDYYV